MFNQNTIIKKNNNGQIYGSGYFLNQIGIEPDLIAAVGNNGIEGYVLSIDINDSDASNLNEADIYNKMRDKAIPLYSQDGTTVIGSYTISKDIYH